MKLIRRNTVWVSPYEVANFNASWPNSSLRDTRAYWFEFDNSGDLIDTDVPQSDDGPAASAMADDVMEWLFNHVMPTWAAPIED